MVLLEGPLPVGCGVQSGGQDNGKVSRRLEPGPQMSGEGDGEDVGASN